MVNIFFMIFYCARKLNHFEQIQLNYVQDNDFIHGSNSYNISYSYSQGRAVWSVLIMDFTSLRFVHMGNCRKPQHFYGEAFTVLFAILGGAPTVFKAPVRIVFQTSIKNPPSGIRLNAACSFCSSAPFLGLSFFNTNMLANRVVTPFLSNSFSHLSFSSNNNFKFLYAS